MHKLKLSLIIAMLSSGLISGANSYLLPDKLLVSSGNIIFSTVSSQSPSYGFLMNAPDSRFLKYYPSLGVGNYNPLTKAGDTGIIFYSSSADGLVIAPWNSGKKGIRITLTGKVGIGTASPSTQLEVKGIIQVSGNVRVTGNVTVDGSIQNSGTLTDLTGSVRTPAGTVLAYAGTSAPGGWLLCDGSAVSRATYATLFTAIGILHGSGDGSTTFNLPNLAGHFPVGINSSDSTMDVVGKTGGNKTVSGTNLPSHYHSVPNHTHSYLDVYWPENRSSETQENHYGSNDTDNNNGSFEVTRTTDAGGADNTGTATSGVTNSTMNIMNPYLVMRYIIKY